MNDRIEETEDQEQPRQEIAVWRPLPALPSREGEETALRYTARLMELLPPTPGDVIDSIAAQIWDAPNMMGENAVWDATSSRDAVGRRYIFHSVHLQPSDHEDGTLPYFLVCKVTDRASGERTVLTTGATNVVVSLVKAQVLGALPWEAEIVGPKRALKSGHVPLHIRWIGKVVEPDDA